MSGGSEVPTVQRIADQTHSDITTDELQLAARNHGMPLEGLRYPITPIGLHYLLIHFDIPLVDAASWRLSIGGDIRNPLSLTLDAIKTRPSVTAAVTLECAGNGRARLNPRPLSQPWLNEAVGTAEWMGTPLRPLLQEAGVLDGAVEVIFTGLDRGMQDGVEHFYERSLSLEDAWHDDLLLAYAVNGQPLPPQHGFPLRLVVPGWYGMAHVKWLATVTVSRIPFQGLQQAVKYHVRQSEGEPGTAVTRILPRSLMVPPGIPDYMSRVRFLPLGRHELEGRAWSGWGPVSRVEVSTDTGEHWADARLGRPVSEFSWLGWTYEWDAKEPGEHILCTRATDASGRVQPLEQPWNLEGVTNNMVQRVRTIITDDG